MIRGQSFYEAINFTETGTIATFSGMLAMRRERRCTTPWVDRRWIVQGERDEEGKLGTFIRLGIDPKLPSELLGDPCHNGKPKTCDMSAPCSVPCDNPHQVLVISPPLVWRTQLVQTPEKCFLVCFQTFRSRCLLPKFQQQLAGVRVNLGVLEVCGTRQRFFQST